jgi:hypothetical protein
MENQGASAGREQDFSTPRPTADAILASKVIQVATVGIITTFTTAALLAGSSITSLMTMLVSSRPYFLIVLGGLAVWMTWDLWMAIADGPKKKNSNPEAGFSREGRRLLRQLERQTERERREKLRMERSAAEQKAVEQAMSDYTDAVIETRRLREQQYGLELLPPDGPNQLEVAETDERVGPPRQIVAQLSRHLITITRRS